MNLHDAIRKLNSSVTTIIGEVAYDINNNIIEYDKVAVQNLINSNAYVEKRFAEYPDFKDYLDGIVKNDQAQIQAYINACLAVKAKYPKP
jgi:hypothetical protein